MKQMLLTPTEAVVTQAAFDALPEYSCSIPTGTRIGKRWKRAKNYRDRTKGWWLGEYEQHPDPDFVRIRWRDLMVVRPG